MSTELVTYENNTGEISNKSYIRDGLAGNFDTVFQMVRLTRETVYYNKPFQNLANKILIDKGFNQYTDDAKKLKAVFDFVTENVAYVSDVAGKIESIKSAAVTLSDGYGDCDDLSILYASILGVLGYEPKFVLATYSSNEQQFAHIYVEVIAKSNRYIFDNAINPPQFNKEVKPYKITSIDIFKANETDSFTGIIKQIGMSLKNLYKHSLETIPTIASFTPIGALSYTALSAGASVASAGLQQDLSLSELGSKINRQLDTIIDGLHKKQIATDYAKISAVQIASQLSSFHITSAEKRKHKVIANGIKNKLQYIHDFAENNNYYVVLNQTGMALGGAAIIGYFGYQIYKHFNR